MYLESVDNYMRRPSVCWSFFVARKGDDSRGKRNNRNTEITLMKIVWIMSFVLYTFLSLCNINTVRYIFETDCRAKIINKWF